MSRVPDLSCDEQQQQQQQQTRSLQDPLHSTSESCVAICSKTGEQCRNAAHVTMPLAALVIPLIGCCTLCTAHSNVASHKLMTITSAVAAAAFNLTLSYDETLVLSNNNNALNTPSWPGGQGSSVRSNISRMLKPP
jgi:hypothetical protein